MCWRKWAQAADHLIYQMLTAMFGGVSQREPRPRRARHLSPGRTPVIVRARAKRPKWLLFLMFGTPVLTIGLVLSAGAEAKGTGYVFVSREDEQRRRDRS